MPVYFATIHAYRTWNEGGPLGYVQRGEGLKPSDPELAKRRAEQASQDPNRFDFTMQNELHAVVDEISQELGVRLHGCATTPTHLHILLSFAEPECECSGKQSCFDGCPARVRAEAYLTRVKRISGFRLAKLSNIEGRRWFSRGWDVVRVWDRGHFDHLCNTYLPKHEQEAGIVRVYE